MRREEWRLTALVSLAGYSGYGFGPDEFDDIIISGIDGSMTAGAGCCATLEVEE